jgi:uncharacterized glyoxalase superfamily protein PhnB
MAVSAKPDGYHTVTPYLIVPDVEGLIAFAERAFGAHNATTVKDNNGRIMHGEMRIGDSVVMMGESNEEFPPMPTMLHLYLEDIDGTYKRALEAGATSTREPRDEFYGDRTAGVQDAYGNQWWLATHVEDLSEEEMARRMAEMGD